MNTTAMNTVSTARAMRFPGATARGDSIARKPQHAEPGQPGQPRYDDALILMSTPAGNDSLFKASIVFPVGWTMSMTRL